MGKSLAELSSELEALDAEEAALGARLEAELADMGELRERLARMRACRAELDDARGRAEELGARVTATAAKAQRMSQQVRELDRAQSRVQATLSVVTAASQLAKSAAVVAAAMDEERFEEAATHIHSVLDRLGDDGAGVASVAAAAPDGSSGVGGRRGSEEDDGRERDSALLAQILAARDALRARALAESAAQPAGNGASPSAGGSEASVLRFVRILPLVGEPAEAFRRLAAFRRASLRAAIAAARTLAEGAARGDESKVAWAELVARALQGTAAAIEADAPFVRARLGGARALARYVVEMHDECRSLGAGLAGALVRSRQLQARIAALREAEAGSGAGAGGGAGCGGAGGCAGSCGSCCCSGGVEAGGGADGERAKALAEVDGAADELCHLLNGGGSYDCYVLQRLDDAADEERRAAAAGADADADADARDDGSVPTLVLLCSQPPPFEPSGAAGTGAANGGGGGGGIGFSLASAYAAEAISASLSHAMRRALSMEVAGARDAAATGGARVGGISGSACVGAGVRGVSCGGSSAPLASSAPDDAFYLVKRAIQRAAHTQSLWVLARVTRAAAQLLRSPYLDTLRSRAKGGGGGPGLALLAAALGGGGGGGAGGSGAGGGQRLGAIGSKLSAAYGATATFVSAGAGVGGSAEPAEPLPFLANLNNLATSLEYLERLEAQQVRAVLRALLAARLPPRALPASRLGPPCACRRRRGVLSCCAVLLLLLLLCRASLPSICHGSCPLRCAASLLPVARAPSTARLTSAAPRRHGGALRSLPTAAGRKLRGDLRSLPDALGAARRHRLLRGRRGRRSRGGRAGPTLRAREWRRRA